MLQGTEAGNKVKLLIIERELFGGGAIKAAARQVFSAYLQRYCGDIDTGGLTAKGAYGSQPLALTTGDIQNFLSLPRPQAAGQTAQMT